MRCLLLMVLLLAGSLVGSAKAEQLSAPKGEVILTISGNIEFTNSENGAEFDLGMLQQFGSTSISTETPWTKGKTQFTGVLLSTILDIVGAKSSSFRAIALDNYWYDVEGFDFDKYPVVVAYKQNGEFMSIRNLGPLWLMYPFDDYPELLTHANKAACVWQLNHLVIQ